MEKIKDVVCYVGTLFAYLIGGFDGLLLSLVIVMIIDYITGVGSAWYNKCLSSRVGVKGIFKKFGYLCIIALSVVVDNVVGSNGIIRTMVLYFFIANDGLSILENLSEMNLPIPKVLKDALIGLREQSEETSESIVESDGDE